MCQYSLSDFDYVLPDALIAQLPTVKRGGSRLLVLGDNQSITHTHFSHFLDYVDEGDLIVFNNTKVIPARLFGVKKSGGKVEALIERILGDHTALAHLRASHAPKVGASLVFENTMEAMVIDRQGDLFVLKFNNDESLLTWLEHHGHLPLPPYIVRDVEKEDYHRYQTVYAKHKGAVAAPTAGLHFDEAMLAAIEHKKIETAFVTLHVGAGTFQPVRSEDLSAHTMHHEIMQISLETCEKINACKKRGKKVIAIGTTVVRALESAAQFSKNSNELQPFSGETNIFITPGFEFKIVDTLLTNFHLPKSTLLMLVCAFSGYDAVMQAYHTAVENQYRFFSYGDAVLLNKRSFA